MQIENVIRAENHMAKFLWLVENDKVRTNSKKVTCLDVCKGESRKTEK